MFKFGSEPIRYIDIVAYVPHCWTIFYKVKGAVTKKIITRSVTIKKNAILQRIYFPEKDAGYEAFMAASESFLRRKLFKITHINHKKVNPADFDDSDLTADEVEKKEKHSRKSKLN